MDANNRKNTLQQQAGKASKNRNDSISMDVATVSETSRTPVTAGALATADASTACLLVTAILQFARNSRASVTARMPELQERHLTAWMTATAGTSLTAG
jgi:methylthioribose-1-phosphate isomerase